MKINLIVLEKWLYMGRISAIPSHYAVDLSYPKNTDYVRKIKRNLSIKHIQGLIIESISKPDLILQLSMWRTFKTPPNPRVSQTARKCAMLFGVCSPVRAVTRSFYGSLLLLMFCKIDSFLPRTHLAHCLSPLSPLNTLVSLLPVGHEIVTHIQLHHLHHFSC